MQSQFARHECASLKIMMTLHSQSIKDDKKQYSSSVLTTKTEMDDYMDMKPKCPNTVSVHQEGAKLKLAKEYLHCI